MGRIGKYKELLNNWLQGPRPSAGLYQSSVLTPDYLSGVEEFPDDTPEQLG